ncbi:MAG: tetratricopeptide repeat protein [Deltaproteobacteria bacterium]|nr:tetratricopeptide repeat protein [Deltaproteobacteria bacterium]
MNKKWIFLVAAPILAAAVVVGLVFFLGSQGSQDAGTPAADTKVRGKIAKPAAPAKEAGEAAPGQAEGPVQVVLTVARFDKMMDTIDEWAAQSHPEKPAPSQQMGQMLGGLDWVDEDRNIVVRGRIGENMMEAQALIPFTEQNENFTAMAGKFGTVLTGPDYYIYAFPPVPQIPDETVAFLQDAAKRKMADSITLETSPARLMAAAGPLIRQKIEQTLAQAQQRPDATDAPSARDAEKAAREAMKVVDQLEVMASQVSDMSLAINLAGDEVRLSADYRPKEGTNFAKFLSRAAATSQKSVLGDYEPEGHQSVIRTLPYDVAGFFDWMNDLYAQFGLDLSALAPVAKQMTGESVMGFSMKDGKLILEGIAALKEEKEAEGPFLDDLLNATLAYLKGMDPYLAEQGEKPPFSMADLLIPLPEGRVRGQRTLGFKLDMSRMAELAASGRPAPPMPFDGLIMRFTLAGDKLLMANDDSGLEKLVLAVNDLKEAPAKGPLFQGTMDMGAFMCGAMEAMLPPEAQLQQAMLPGDLVLVFEAGLDKDRAWLSYTIPVGGMMNMQKALEETATAAASSRPVQPVDEPVDMEAYDRMAQPETLEGPGSAMDAPVPGPMLSPAQAFMEKAELAAIYGNPQAAEKNYKKALEKDPDNPNALFGLAMALMDQRKFSEAMEKVNDALEKDPDNPDFLYGRARIHLLSGNKDAAMVDFAVAAEKGSADAQRYLNRQAS